MDPRFISHNYHLINPEEFDSLDPQLLLLKRCPYTFRSPLIEQFPTEISGIYLLSGGRQIGKTTLLKQWMSHLLKRGVAPTAIAFLSGELIDDHHTLLHLLQQQLAEMPKDQLKFLILDEVSYIKDWDKGIKFAADSGLLNQTIFMITGSDMTILEEARARFPGRRGKAAVQEFHLYPLSFGEFVKLKRIDIENTSQLFHSFDEYLIHGGYMTAINDLAEEKKILEATLITYSDWIRGDMLKKNKQEIYLREVVAAIIKRYGSQITWNTLAKDLSIDHPSTVADYVHHLESMDALFVQSALLEDRLIGAPKKAKKAFFTDPFIYHALSYWIKPTLEPFEKQIKTSVYHPVISSILVEACVATHYRRYFPTYFIKGDGEVDVAYIKEKRFWPVEVKWTQQIQKSELKQFAKYPNGIILTKWKERKILDPFPTIPVPIALIELENSENDFKFLRTEKS